MPADPGYGEPFPEGLADLELYDVWPPGAGGVVPGAALSGTSGGPRGT